MSGINITVQIQPSFQTVATGVTDANGQSAFGLAPGTYRLALTGSSRPNTPQNFTWDRRDLAVTSSQQFDIQLPVLRVSGTIANTASQPVPNARITFSNNQNVTSLFLNSSGNNLLGAADGTYAYFAFPGSTSITVAPPSGLGLAALTETVAFSADTSRNYTLATGTTVTGVLRGYQAQPIAFANIQIYTWPQSQFITSVNTDSAGNYSLTLPSLCRLIVSGNNGPGTSFTWDRRNLAVTGTTMDIQIPVVRITGDVTNPTGGIVPGATVRATQSSSTTDLAINSSAQSTADSAGRYAMLAVTGPTNLFATPPTGSNAGMAVDALTVTTDTERDLVLPDALRISGVVRGYGAMPVSLATVDCVARSDALAARFRFDHRGRDIRLAVDRRECARACVPWRPS